MERDLRCLRAALLLAAASSPAVLLAQAEIVQPLPPEGAARLNDALGRLARSPTDVAALIDAGEAALAVGDIAAAIGFFGRANELSPNNSRVKLGLATSYVRSRRPVEALRLFAEAERAGVDRARMAEDRALAFDLVGDAASAQELYRLALANGAGAETRRRLALSQAISGDRAGFEATLLPLLEEKDLAAFRTRAFGLAILGQTKEAIGIADAMLPQQMAARVRPYLEYMPRLTQAQQAAAGSLGIFPRTASIGTDEPQIASYAGTRTAEARPAAASSPRGTAAQAEPARQDPRTQQRRRRPDRTGSSSTGSAGQPQELAPAAASSRQGDAVRVAPPPPPPASAPAATFSPQELMPRPVEPQRSTASQPESQPATPPVRILPAPPPSPPPAPAVEQQEELPSLEDAFASFTLESRREARPAAGAVDITRIAIPREVPKPPPPPPPPPPPVHPARHWVQVATGKDRSALAFDWRRIERKSEGKLKGKGPFVARWVQANRLLAGPFKSDTAARDFMNDLKKLQIDSFTFHSAEGEVVEPLK
ncbi:tetratricopeptide repeat protein [Erythrobacter mangrovi]|uniref:Tetratricopeptide repeat protein n=1 Tax=Erythrobacter mangrovi TaxID=2739433 RepID=A0A7D4B674_9SPHN|nr:tetratricopeptide repeat protein [Erythrobacter mangrovi]QKG70123.1 tetratricopeptide repeat protein [Erythrobacter mangrovi]